MRQAEATFSELLWQGSRHRHLRVAETDMQVSGGWGVGKLQDGKERLPVEAVVGAAGGCAEVGCPMWLIRGTFGFLWMIPTENRGQN